MFSSADLAPDQTGRLEDADVARHAGERHGQRIGEVGDPGVTGPQGHQEGASGGIGERGVGVIEDLIFKQVVDYSHHRVILNITIE